ncbi:M28 family peptidase [Sphingomonas panacisoli]|uniref:M28 family peptidase n=1 Tax=Sphingomonas panacisoli TaxID=1813879 RepID=A0A5B8LLI7_9SPHN|nr:M28 family metallopeptidase [Sphingomonas panacisoli]QDZ08953.1 M28 family peptidase [Sphingomonas panacisoli]
MFRLIGSAMLLLGAGAAVAQTDKAATTPQKESAASVNARVMAPLPADQAAMKAHVMFLASDAMRGREAGSHEFDIAAQYVAAQFYAAGLRPGGEDGGYLQRVPLVGYKLADKGSFVWTPGKGTPQTLVFGEDFSPAPNAAKAETSLTAPVVFVGYGIVAPDYKRDDYKGVDVKGKIVAYVGGAPKGYDGEERAFFSSPRAKAAIAAQHGAIGAIQIESPRVGRGSLPFAITTRTWDTERVTWAQRDGSGKNDGLPVLGTISMAGAAKLFAGARMSWDQVKKAADSDDAKFTAFPLSGNLSAALKTTIRPMPSSNVIGIIPGTDPKMKDEVVILSAHLDHIGVGKPDKLGDTINNGAEDNAIGIASLIEEAKRFVASGKPPRRTVMFLAVTAEEKGLIGSDYFANNPTVPLKSIVADVNLDMPLITYKFEDMVVFGAPRSTLGPIVKKAVESVGVELAPDPMPDEGLFVRSDHFRFVQKGIPSVFLWPGYKGGGKAAWEDFMKNHYHQPSDEIGLPLDWEQGVRFVTVNYTIAREIADNDERPRWNKGDYFGTYFGGYGAK